MWPMAIAMGASAGLNYLGAQQQNSAQAGMMDKQMAFEEQMSSTAYQRASADMKAAGLNPMMMFGSGGPASTPTVQQASVVNPLEGTGRAIAGIPQAMLEAKQTQAATDKVIADTKLSNANTAVALANAKVAATAGKKAEIEGSIIDYLREKVPAALKAVSDAGSSFSAKGNATMEAVHASSDSPWGRLMYKGGK